jgi:tetratricopeptide (TPR) repeat protein
VPVWHAGTQRSVQDGKLAVVAIVQDQHPDRARLFLQWKRIGWPVLADSLDLLNLDTVPLTVAVDEYGIVRFSELPMAAAKTIEQTFVNQTYERPASPAPIDKADLAAPRGVRSKDAADAWRAYGDAMSVYGAGERWTEAIDAYRHAARLVPTDGPLQFRLGSALRKRYDSLARRAEDFQEAEEHWAKALDIDPNRYIWRRRVQQYGPRLETPYDFFDWIRDARAEIAGRGETPIALTVEPGDSEYAVPDAHARLLRAPAAEPDVRGRIRRDRGEFVAVDTATVPPSAAPGDTVRVHLMFRPNARTKAHWTNENDPLLYWITPPPAWTAEPRALVAPNAPTAVSQEPRTLEYDIKVPVTEKPGSVSISGYALYYVCEDVKGVCMYRRRDISVPLQVAAKRK